MAKSMKGMVEPRGIEPSRGTAGEINNQGFVCLVRGMVEPRGIEPLTSTMPL